MRKVDIVQKTVDTLQQPSISAAKIEKYPFISKKKKF